MAIPDFQSVMRPVLAEVADGLPISLKALREQVIEQFQLREIERNEMLRLGWQRVINTYLPTPSLGKL